MRSKNWKSLKRDAVGLSEIEIEKGLVIRRLCAFVSFERWRKKVYGYSPLQRDRKSR